MCTKEFKKIKAKCGTQDVEQTKGMQSQTSKNGLSHDLQSCLVDFLQFSAQRLVSWQFNYKERSDINPNRSTSHQST